MTLQTACGLIEHRVDLGRIPTVEIIEAMRVLTEAHLDPKVNFWEDNSYACYVAELFAELDERGAFDSVV